MKGLRPFLQKLGPWTPIIGLKQIPARELSTADPAPETYRSIRDRSMPRIRLIETTWIAQELVDLREVWSSQV